ncbi:phage baseplate assembly protein [Amorphus coralli]|uniref:phage baseplate assembly protein n=1 Tax=Amorphus coralli TaxID=340680 RepID=UPI00036FD509|nr:phage baseplate assembly protein [Amorphus coralli]
MDQDTAGKLRGMMRRCTIRSVRDDGEMQTCSVEVAAGVWRDEVEVIMPYGFAAHVPPDGALGIVLTIGGDEGDLIVLPIANPSNRMGGLQEGEVGLYNKHGDKLVLTAGGDLDIKTGASVTVTSPAGVSVEGDALSLKAGSGKLE